MLSTTQLTPPDREINLVLGDNSRPLGSKKAGSLILESTPTALRFKVKKLPRTSYVSDFLGMLRAGTIVPGVVPFFAPTPLSVARRLFSNGKAVDLEEEAPGTGIFRRDYQERTTNGIKHHVSTASGQPWGCYAHTYSPTPTVYLSAESSWRNTSNIRRCCQGWKGYPRRVLTLDLLQLTFRQEVRLMSVTITAIQLAAALRIGDGVTALVEPQAGVLNRILASATALVESYAPNAPESDT